MVKNVFQLISTVAIKQKKKVIFQQYILHEKHFRNFFCRKEVFRIFVIVIFSPCAEMGAAGLLLQQN